MTDRREQRDRWTDLDDICGMVWVVVAPLLWLAFVALVVYGIVR